jgi:hypothetical protein
MTDELKQIVFLLKQINKKLYEQNEYWKYWKKLKNECEKQQIKYEEEREERKQKVDELIGNFMNAGMASLFKGNPAVKNLMGDAQKMLKATKKRH